MSLYDETVPQLRKMLHNLERWLDEAADYAESRGFDPELLLQMRLYPDMFPLVRQVQSACDTAKFIGSRCAGMDAPVNLDTEATLAELRERIAFTRDFLEGFDPESFEGAATRELHLPFLQGGWVSGADYVREFALPNFYFHITTAYGILRHNGVKLGKRAFIGGMNVQGMGA